MRSDHPFVNVALLLILAIIWGSSYILMHLGLKHFSAFQVSMMRIFFAFLALLPFCWKAIKQINKSNIGYVLIVAILGSGIPSYLYPLTITHVESSITGIINTLTPLFTFVFALLFFQYKATLPKVIGIIIGLKGASFLIVRFDSIHTISLNYYALFGVLATLCYGLSSNILKSKLGNIKALPLTALTFAFIGPFALFLLLQTNFIPILKSQDGAFNSLMAILTLGVVGTAFALVLFNYLIQRTDAIYASSVTYLMPIVALFWGFVFKEEINFHHAVGLFLILIGVYFVNKKKKQVIY